MTREDKKKYDEITSCLSQSLHFKEVINALKILNLPPLWIAGGFLRNTVWDCIYHVKSEPVINDVDIIYIPENEGTLLVEHEIENKLSVICPQYKWSVKDQHRMAKKHGHAPYKSISEAIGFWVETATAIAIDPLNPKDNLILPFGADDLLNGIIRPGSPVHQILARARAEEKNWLKRWPKLVFEEEPGLPRHK